MQKKPNLKKDILAGFSVFLLALPLCLGIAIASNFPAISGILSAVVAGIVATWWSGAQLTIKGPAAGLIVITLGAVTELGMGDWQLGYERTLAIGVVAAIIQIIIGSFKKAEIAEIIPPAVIHAMLAAIGIIIVSKQIYLMMGITPAQAAPLTLIASLPSQLIHINPIIFAIGLLALLIAVIWPKIKKINMIPSTIMILLAVIPLSIYLNLNSSHFYSFMQHDYALGPEFLINLPNNFFTFITFPDFSAIFSFTSIKYIILFSVIGSIESLLTVCAVDTMTRHLQASNLNKDLRAVGIGNLVSAFIGGLPMISEIVRSKANIDYGATSSLANFFHGIFMLLAVLFFSNTLNLIPLSALAALLVFVGLRLAAPQEFINSYKTGIDQFAIFLVTFFTTLTIDLLIGISAGIILKIIIILSRGNKLTQLLSPVITIKRFDDTVLIQIQGPLTFLSYLKLKNKINIMQAENKKIILNLDAITYLDHTVAQKLYNLTQESTKNKITIEENQQLAHFYKKL